MAGGGGWNGTRRAARPLHLRALGGIRTDAALPRTAKLVLEDLPGMSQFYCKLPDAASPVPGARDRLAAAADAAAAAAGAAAGPPALKSRALHQIACASEASSNPCPPVCPLRAPSPQVLRREPRPTSAFQIL